MQRLLVISHVGITGARRGWSGKNRVGELVEDLADRGWRPTLVARRRRPLPFLTHRFSNAVTVVPLGRLASVAWAVLRADAAVALGPSLLSYALATVVGRRCVIYAGNAWGLQEGYAGWRLSLEHLAARRASTVITAGEAVAGYFQAWNPDVRPCVPLVHRDVAARLTSGVGTPKGDELRVLFVGSLSSAKGVPAILEAAARLPEVAFRLVGPDGDAEGPALRAHAERLENVSVEEYAEWDELSAAYEWASVLVLPSRVEGFPRAAYEAAAFGAALILSPVGGVPHRLEDRRDALFVRPGDGVDLERALLEVRDDAALRERLADAAAVTLASAFVAPTAAAQFDAVLRRVAPARPLPHRERATT